MNAPTALYRRYRPDSFAQVIGQEHVTAPLMAALDKNRVNHAYLFSGPRGCGKTTSARILARCLNCAQGPTSHPCGECDSCVELARGGAGSLDVIEIDAASHGGVDDARDLRERATFAPIRDRYKIFIIDEAHMVTSAGFNALLKIVEEPPEHIKFIFATTEPDKVIGTIRSRTHHYPFRLVPPEPLMAYLAQLCEQEQVAVAPGVLSLVVRAGGGSVRDSLSVLDQLMAGAGASGLDYDLAVDLLGYTHASLLDDVVEALAASDSATVFKSVDRVIQTGHDPRRFVEDLLERFRDLIIVQAMPESAHAILRGTPDELIARMQTQAAQLGAAELSRAADVTNAAFNEMTGATSPRLHLELLGARLLLPGADSSARGMATRLDQLERRLNYGGAPAGGDAPVHAPVAATPSAPIPTGGFPSTTTAPADSGIDPSNGGLAAVRAQLARAKEAAGAEVAARHATETTPTTQATSPADSSWGLEAEPSSEATSTAGASRQANTESHDNAATRPPSQHEDQQATTRPATSWDDLPTPTGTPEFVRHAQETQSQQIRSEQPPTRQHNQQVAPQAAPAPQPTPAPTDAPVNTSTTSSTVTAGAAPSSGTTGIEVIRRAWPEILGALRNIRMASWVIVNQNVVPQTFDGQELRVGLPSSGLIATFSNSGHLENLQQAINEVLGLSVRIFPADGEAPKASAEPNPKVPAGNRPPLHGRGSGRIESEPPAANVPPQTSQAPSEPEKDSWGLPASTTQRAWATTADTTDPQTAQPLHSMPTTTTAPTTSSGEATQPLAPAQAGPPTQAVNEASSAWDGPLEPSDPWDESNPESYPADDPYESSHDYTTATTTPVPAAPATHLPPKVSPIAAWTTGWDVPVTEPTPTETAEPEAPRRSSLLAEKLAAKAAQAPNTNEVQDWGVSLGQTRRSDVTDPGWGSIASAPDWAQPGTADQDPPSGNQASTSIATRAPTQAPNPAANATAAKTHAAAAEPNATSPAAAAAPTSQLPTATSIPAGPESTPSSNSTTAPEPLSMYQRLSNSPAAKAGRAQAPAVAAASPYVEDVPSPDDVTIEESGVVGQAAVERILGGVLVEERTLNPSS